MIYIEFGLVKLDSIRLGWISFGFCTAIIWDIFIYLCLMSLWILIRYIYGLFRSC